MITGGAPAHFDIQKFFAPGEGLEAAASAQGVPAETLMRDYIAVSEPGRDGELVVVVGDMANNLTGSTYNDPERAAGLGLPPEFRFNGGLLGSLVLSGQITACRQPGRPLVEAANAILAKTYRQYGMGDAASLDPAERFTGYLTHALITPNMTTLTGVGDVYAWVNGRLEIGEEKAVDTEKERLIDTLAAALEIDRDLQNDHIANILGEFAVRGRIDDALTTTLCHTLLTAISKAERPGRQTVYRPVDDLITPWQIRTLQNTSPASHSWAYGAVDGTSTPKEYIQTYSIPTADLETLLIATDGSKPRAGVNAVQALLDLEPKDPKHSEQSVAILTRPGNAEV